MTRSLFLAGALFAPTLTSALTVQTYEAFAAFEENVDVPALNALFDSLGIPVNLDTFNLSNNVLSTQFQTEIEGRVVDCDLLLDLSDLLKETNQNGIPDEAELALASQITLPLTLTMTAGTSKVVTDIKVEAQRAANSSFLTGILSYNAKYYERGREVDAIADSQSLYYDLDLTSWYGDWVPADTRLEGDDVTANIYRKDGTTLIVRNFLHRGYPVGDVELSYTGSAYVGQFLNESLDAPFYLSISDLPDSDNDGTPDLTDIDAQGFLYTKAGGDKQGGWMKLGHFGWFIGSGFGRDWYYSDKFGTWVWLDDGPGESFLIYQSDAGWLYTEKTLGVYYRYSDGHWLSFNNRADGRIKFWDYDAGTFIWFD